MANDEYDLQKSWDEACKGFQKTTSEDLTTKTKQTPDQVLDEIGARLENDAKKSEKFRAAKDVLNKTLECIDSLGTLAVQGASVVCHFYILVAMSGLMSAIGWDYFKFTDFGFSGIWPC